MGNISTSRPEIADPSFHQVMHRVMRDDVMLNRNIGNPENHWDKPAIEHHDQVLAERHFQYQYPVSLAPPQRTILDPAASRLRGTHVSTESRDLVNNHIHSSK